MEIELTAKGSLIRAAGQRRACWPLLLLCFWLVKPILAQQPESPSAPEAKTEEKSKANEEKKEAKDKKEEKEKKEHRGAIVAAPIPISSPTIGSGIVPVLGYVFPFSTKDQVSPPSSVGAVAGDCALS